MTIHSVGDLRKVLEIFPDDTPLSANLTIQDCDVDFEVSVWDLNDDARVQLDVFYDEA